MSPRLVDGSVPRNLLRLAGPMFIGITSVVLFNVVDTMWVGRLGTAELAAMTFTFPVVFVVMSLSVGLAVGTTSVLSRAIGAGDRTRVCRVTTDALFLSVATVTALALLGFATIDPLFRALGADDTMLPLIRSYMVPWYFGVGFVVIPMVGNGAIRATGDAKSPAVIMVIAGLVNFVADPLLIFGVGPFPRLELQGAAYATVASFVLAFVASLWLLTKREKMVDMRMPTLSCVLASWRDILRVGLPAVGTNVLMPLSAGILTRMVSAHGQNAVGAFGVGVRIESLSTIGISALGASLIPFVGQNHGAGRIDRVQRAIWVSTVACLIWGAAVAVLLSVLARPIASAFNDTPNVVDMASLYMRIVPVACGAAGIAMIAGSVFNAVNRPFWAMLIVAVRLFVLAVPLAYLGDRFFGIPGLFAGIALANGLIGVVAWTAMRRSRDLTMRGPGRLPSPGEASEPEG